jgi:hypothetical protein
MKTLILALDTWDLIIDLSGNIAVAEAPYSVTQDVSSSIMVYLGEVWYDTTDGIDYLGRVLGERPSLQFLKSKIEAQALKVPTVARAVCSFVKFEDRVLDGQVLITDTSGVDTIVLF